jgi:hypothetical protein
VKKHAVAGDQDYGANQTAFIQRLLNSGLNAGGQMCKRDACVQRQGGNRHGQLLSSVNIPA